MNRLPFFRLRTTLTAGSDAAIVLPDEDPVAVLADAVVLGISTEVEVEIGGITVHLAMLLYPCDWDDDWRALGIEDAGEFVASLMKESS